MDPGEEVRFVAWAHARAGALQRTAYLLCGDWQVAEDLVQEPWLALKLRGKISAGGRTRR
jgi:DNA-directed RNA polymerase specialized sigma24 family protein